MTAIFVTATGTGIGKTFITTGLISHFRRHGRAVEAAKPVATGFDPAAAATSDPGLLLAALGRPIVEEEIARMAPWRFKAPLSPDLAAKHEGRALSFDALVDFSYRVAGSSAPMVLIEGIGGVMVPLDDRHTVLDWMAALRLPLILVTGSYLGTISHALTARDVLARRDLKIAAIVVNETAGSPVPLADTVATIARFAQPIAVLGLPRLPAGPTGHPVFAELADLL